MGEKWICSCGAECDGNFCTKCGSPRPVVQEPVVPEPAPIEEAVPAEPAAPEVAPIEEKAPAEPAAPEPAPFVEAAPAEPAVPEPAPIEEAAPAAETPVTPEPAAAQPESAPIEEVIPVEPAVPEASSIEEVMPAEPVVPEAAPIEEAAPAAETPVTPEPAAAAQPEPAPVPQPAVSLAPGQWVCPNCGAIVSGRFCSKCGTPMPAGAVPAGAAAGAAMGAAPMAAPAPVVQKPKKKTGLIIGLVVGGVVLIAAVVICLFLFILPGGYKTNTVPAEKGKEVPEGYLLLVDENQDFSLLYTKNESVEVTEDEGSFVYPYSDGETTYIHIRRYEGKTSPSKYFKAVAEELKKEDPNIPLSDVKEVTAGDKTLYMVSALTESDSLEQLFLEIYDDFYITYSTLGIEEQPNTPLYNTITTLIPSAEGYAAPKLPDPVEYKSEMGNFSVVVPGGFEISDFSSGIYAQSEDAGVFAAYLNSDTIGSIIYDHYDFAEQSQRIDNYVADIMGAKSVEIGEGKLETINGTEYSVYPASMVLKDGGSGDGKIYVADADPFGIYLLYYFDEGNAKESVGEEFVHSMKILGKPNISDYTVFYAGEHGLGKLAVKTELIGKDDLADSALAITSPNGKDVVLVEFFESTTMDKLVSKRIEDLKKEFGVDATATEAVLPDEGRYYFGGYEIKYEANGIPRTYFIAGLQDSKGNLVAVTYEVDDTELEWANEVVENIIWSWKLN